MLFAQYELYRVLQQRGYRVAELLGLGAGALLLIGAYRRGPQALSFAITMALLATFAWYVLDRERRGATEAIAATMLGLLYVPFLAAHVVMMRNLPDGAGLTVAYIGLVAFYDIGAYAFGTLFGKHPLAPSVSPKKSREGALGATLLIALLGLVLGPLLSPLSALESLGLAFVAAVLAPLGDLAESLIKRDLGVKDMGTVFPGHGGALDRIDALLLVAPAAYWYMRAVL